MHHQHHAFLPGLAAATVLAFIVLQLVQSSQSVYAAGIVVLAVVGLAMVLRGRRASHLAMAGPAAARHGFQSDHHWGHRAWSFRASWRHEDRADRALSHLEERLNLTDGQREAWAAFREAVATAAQIADRTGCIRHAEAGAAVTDWEQRLEGGLLAARQLRATLTVLEQALTKAQLAELNAAWARHGTGFTCR